MCSRSPMRCTWWPMRALMLPKPYTFSTKIGKKNTFTLSPSARALKMKSFKYWLTFSIVWNRKLYGLWTCLVCERCPLFVVYWLIWNVMKSWLAATLLRFSQPRNFHLGRKTKLCLPIRYCSYHTLNLTAEPQTQKNVSFLTPSSCFLAIQYNFWAINFAVQLFMVLTRVSLTHTYSLQRRRNSTVIACFNLNFSRRWWKAWSEVEWQLDGKQNSVITEKWITKIKRWPSATSNLNENGYRVQLELENRKMMSNLFARVFRKCV